MGFPIRNNIFQPGSKAQRYLANFPIQIAVLFSARDHPRFSDAFKSLFLHLDRLTNRDVAFFAVLDPPTDWLQVAGHRPWWQEYQQQVGVSGFTMDEDVLVIELARLFDVEWRELPAIITGTNLWNGEFVVAQTSAETIETQFQALVGLVEEWGRPLIEQVYESLGNLSGTTPRYLPPRSALIRRLDDLYSILETAQPDRNGAQRFIRLTEQQFRDAEYTLRRLRRTQQDETLLDHQGDASLTFFPPTLVASTTEMLLEDVAGRMVAPAIVAQRVSQRLAEDQTSPALNELDSESRIMAHSALLMGAFFESVEDSGLDAIFRNSFETRRRHGQIDRPPLLDYALPAAGAWKAFELEVNLSVIQAAREARGVPMPKRFAEWDPNFRGKNYKVTIGQGRDGRPEVRPLNTRPTRYPDDKRHKFLALGDALAVTEVMNASPDEDFRPLIQRAIGGDLPADLIPTWRDIHRLRNIGSHTHSLSRRDYDTVIAGALKPAILGPLMDLKQFLKHQH